MKKIFLLLNGDNTENTIHYGCHLASLTKARLVGIFPAKLDYDYAPALQTMYGMTYVESVVAADLAGQHQIEQEIARDVSLFRQICESKGIRAGICRYTHLTAPELAEESRFADLIVVDGEAVKSSGQPRGHFSRELLAMMKCPVIVTPSLFEPVEEVIFCYDSSPSALFAMKQFTYLFPDTENIRATVLTVTQQEDKELPEKTKLRNWLSGYYDSSDFTILHGKTEEELFNYLMAKKNVLLVMGAYGRSVLSRFFHHSRADMLIAQPQCPVFITHHH